MSSFGADGLMLITAFIWGMGFVAQALGMEHLGPFSFNAVRFPLGALGLVPVIVIFWRRYGGIATVRPSLLWGAIAGVVLFVGANFQQVGILFTTAGNAGFITGLYVVIVPFIGAMGGMRIGVPRWFGAAISAAGLYLLSFTGAMSIGRGDGLVLIGAFVWAGHVLVIGHGAPKSNPLLLSAVQFAVAGALSLVVALFTEHLAFDQVRLAWQSVLYSGLGSTAMGYTLQVVAQRRAHPAHAAIILSLEGAFAALGGWVFLGETMSVRMLAGGGLMLSGMILSQWEVLRRTRPLPVEPATAPGPPAEPES